MHLSELQMYFVRACKEKNLKEVCFVPNKFMLYLYTIKSMKLSQVYYRLRKIMKMNCTIGSSAILQYQTVNRIVTISELDFDPVFLARFNVEEIMGNKVTFLHSSRNFSWNEDWNFKDKSALWNFNLHYFEFLFPLLYAYKETGNACYLEKSKTCIQSWVVMNPKNKKGAGWSSYTIALRLTNWLSYYEYIKNELDESFKKTMLDSMFEQYRHLSLHVEKDLLGNHYFENLKALLLCSIFFKDDLMFHKVLKEYKKECQEQILGDGMHFELSPMYHKIIFEDVVRVAITLRESGHKDNEIESYIQPMLNVAWSLEEGLERIPLFNDSGNNVAKSLNSLVNVCETYFGLKPVYISQMKESGFYIFKFGQWKAIVDAGQPGPSYIPGHAHCDAMSFELFKNGKPVIVNCGTYGYQCEERGFFRSTAAHNTVMIDGIEQSQCWAAFRLAKKSSLSILNIADTSISMELTDQKGNKVQRTISIDDNYVSIKDLAKGHKLSVYYHFASDISEDAYTVKENNVKFSKEIMEYAEDYGEIKAVKSLRFEASDALTVTITLDSI